MNLDCPKTNAEFRELADRVSCIAARCWANVKAGSFAENYWQRISSNALTLWRIAADACDDPSPEDYYADLRDTLRGPADERLEPMPARDDGGDDGGGE